MGWHYVQKIEAELLSLGEISLPDNIYRNMVRPEGPDTLSMDEIDAFILNALYQKDPQQFLELYVNCVCVHTGTIVCPSTMLKWFLKAFPSRSGLCKSNLVPYDKFCPGNIAKAKEYI